MLAFWLIEPLRNISLYQSTFGKTRVESEARGVDLLLGIEPDGRTPPRAGIECLVVHLHEARSVDEFGHLCRHRVGAFYADIDVRLVKVAS